MQPSYPAIPANEVTLTEQLGAGTFGKVYKGMRAGSNVAVKKLNGNVSTSQIASAMRELYMMCRNHHPNIVQFIGASTDPGQPVLIITELLDCDLEAVIYKKDLPLSIFDIIRMSLDVARGMSWLHNSKPPVIHRDLKPKNLLLDKTGRVKICDFGLSELKRNDFLQDRSGCKGTPLWMAPEVLKRQPFDQSVDIYSFGLILWAMVARSEPFQEFTQIEPFTKAICDEHYRPPIPPQCHPRLSQLMHHCWAHDPAQRPTFEAVILELNDILLDLIGDPEGKRVWMRLFKISPSPSPSPSPSSSSSSFGSSPAAAHPREVDIWSVSTNDFVTAFFDSLAEGEEQNFNPLPPPFTSHALSSASNYQLNIILRTEDTDTQQCVIQELQRRYGSKDPIYHPRMYSPSNEIEMACLAKMVDPDDTKTVTVAQFSLFLSHFGPIIDPHTRRIVIVERLTQMLHCKWFHGSLSLHEATSLLSEDPRLFLVRFSSQPGCFTISYNGRLHHRITYDAATGIYINEQHRFLSMSALLSHFFGAKDVIPCSGSRFQALFQIKESSSDNGYAPSGYVGGDVAAESGMNDG